MKAAIIFFALLFSTIGYSAQFETHIDWVPTANMTEQDFNAEMCLTYLASTVSQSPDLQFELEYRLQGMCEMVVNPRPATVKFTQIQKAKKCAPAVYTGTMDYHSGIIPTKPVKVTLMDYRGIQCRKRIPGPMMMVIKQGGTSSKYFPVKR